MQTKPTIQAIIFLALPGAGLHFFLFFSMNTFDVTDELGHECYSAMI